MARVGQQQLRAGVEESEFAQAMLEPPELELDVGEGGGRRLEGDLGPALADRVADDETLYIFQALTGG